MYTHKLSNSTMAVTATATATAIALHMHLSIQFHLRACNRRLQCINYAQTRQECVYRKCRMERALYTICVCVCYSKKSVRVFHHLSKSRVIARKKKRPKMNQIKLNQIGFLCIWFFLGYTITLYRRMW